MASDSKNSQFTSICGIPIRTGNAEFQTQAPLAATENVIKEKVLKIRRFTILFKNQRENENLFLKNEFKNTRSNPKQKCLNKMSVIRL